MKLYSRQLTNGHRIKQEFANNNRDYYPIGLYQALYDYLDETHGEDDAVELDVIAICCDLSETRLADTDFEDTDELVEHLRNETTVLYVDGETVYHWVY